MSEYSFICGLDEAGRGPLAGPVVAACVYIPESVRGEQFWSQITDSKIIPKAKHEALYRAVREHAVCGIAETNVEEIDRINILQASLLAMERAYAQMMDDRLEMIENAQSAVPPQSSMLALIDGNQTPKNMPCATRTVVKGESKYLEIAAASILAKVTRDRIMKQLHEEFPHYGWATNSGYGSKQHREAIVSHGITPHHRRSFAPVRNALAA